MFFRRTTAAAPFGERLIRRIMVLTLKRVTRQLVVEFQQWKRDDPANAAIAQRGYFLAVARMDKIIQSMERRTGNEPD